MSPRTAADSTSWSERRRRIRCPGFHCSFPVRIGNGVVGCPGNLTIEPAARVERLGGPVPDGDMRARCKPGRAPAGSVEPGPVRRGESDVLLNRFGFVMRYTRKPWLGFFCAAERPGVCRLACREPPCTRGIGRREPRPCTGLECAGAVDGPALSSCFSSNRSRPGRNFVIGRSMHGSSHLRLPSETGSQIVLSVDGRRSSGGRGRPVAHRGQVGRPRRVHRQESRRAAGAARARGPGSPARGTARTAPGCTRRPS